jgi:uncharacterized protein YaaN involved in tellurite resistance
MKISFFNLINTYPFYKKCRDLWTETQVNQIIKGLEKYKEPLTPKHHTPKQLVTHAIEEAVDLTHYIVALGEQNEELTETVYRQTVTIAALEERIEYLERFEPLGVLLENKPPYADLDDL